MYMVLLYCCMYETRTGICLVLALATVFFFAEDDSGRSCLRERVVGAC